MTKAAARWNLAQQSENPPWHDQDFEAGTTYGARFTHDLYPGSALSTFVFPAYRPTNPREHAVLYEARWLISTDSADLTTPILWAHRHRGTLDLAIFDADHAERTAARWADRLATAPGHLSGQFLDHTLAWHGIPRPSETTDYPSYNNFLAGYIDTAFWATSIGDAIDTWPDDDDRPSPDTSLELFGFDESHIAAPDLSAIEYDCGSFFAYNPLELIRYAGAFGNCPAAWRQAGHDFWCTRALTGEGFYTRQGCPDADALTRSAEAFGETDFYLGDDGKIHVSPLPDPE